MIDGMMGCDAFDVTSDGRTYVGIVTDDDDLLPAALSAHGANAGVLVWIRSRGTGSAINDPSLLNEGLRIHQFR